MVTEQWRAAVYLDDRASEKQAEALGAIFSGAAGGHPAALAAHIGEVMGVASAPVTFDADESSRAIRIGEIADIKITAIETVIPDDIMQGLLLLRIHTDAGILGHGETYYVPEAVAAMIHTLWPPNPTA